MNKSQWKKYRHDWRSVAPALYMDASPLPYHRVKEIEKYFDKAKVSYCRAPSDIAYLWSVAKHAIERGVNRQHCFNAVRSFMRRNTYADPRQAAVQGHPCYWDNYSKLD